ncbi:hypothetical protein [Nitrobacter sp. TKz-YC01]|uniref:hypothetical protein n=1 Tax=Nitrobacter sp. TKz-YC01 TaxID=3398703 RepID=UPI003A10055F
MDEKVTGIKNIQIAATTRYPIVSAYEFEFLKTEEVVQRIIEGCTIYFILQRPLMMFNNVVPNGLQIQFDIVDTVNPPLHCMLDLEECKLFKPGESCDIEFQFYKKIRDEMPPLNDVAAFKAQKLDGTFVVWETPQKLLYEALVNGLPLHCEGDVEPYLTYTVHYIGKAFSQSVWDRLTGHEKMQKILTLEPTFATANPNNRAPFEIALLMLDIEGVTEANVFSVFDFAVPAGVKPIEHPLDTEAEIKDYLTCKINLKSPELTSEVEAKLIHLFKPDYNEKKFDSYPNIQKGTRSLGYTSAELIIGKLPAILKTATHTQGIIAS